MTPELANFIGSLPLHTILLIGIIVLWRDNKRLSEKLENVRQVASSAHSLIVAQDARQIDEKALKSALGRKPHNLPTDEPYEAMPPYRKSDKPQSDV